MAARTARAERHALPAVGCFHIRPVPEAGEEFLFPARSMIEPVTGTRLVSEGVGPTKGLEEFQALEVGGIHRPMIGSR